MKKNLPFIGFVLVFFIVYLTSCNRQLCVEDLGEMPQYAKPEIQDTLIQGKKIYFAGIRKLQNQNVPEPGKPKRRIVFRNLGGLPLNEGGMVKFYIEINETGDISYIETLPETTMTDELAIKKVIKTAQGYKYEANYSIPTQAVILTITLDF